MWRCLLLFFSVIPTLKAGIVGCDPTYLSAAYSEAHQFAAIEGARYAIMANNAYSAANGQKFHLPIGWRELKDHQELSNFGLAYQVFEKFIDGQRELVIAYRGTEDLVDWWHGAITGEQYQQALALFDAIRSNYPHAGVAVTGHSLGGGLALHVSMHRNSVPAYAFNPSPITHPPLTPVKNRRVVYWEYDDPLHFGRKWLMNVPGTVFWRFDFVKKNGHQSEALAKGLLMLAALRNPEFHDVLTQNCAINPFSH